MTKSPPSFPTMAPAAAPAAPRRGQPPLSVQAPPPLQPLDSPALLPDLPPISALFLIDFDVKAGYTIIWKEAVAGVELEGVVEFKSLPSGLHTVPEDLIYFVHEGGYAGLSAFVNIRVDEEEARHARMIAVGILVPLTYGRLGRAWRHSQGLKDMASKLAVNRKQTDILDEYWARNGASEPISPKPLDDGDQYHHNPLRSPSISFKTSSSHTGRGKGHARGRSASDGAALMAPGHGLSPFHPAWSLTSLLETFGPLIFPIYRAALLRKRILISTHAPVHEVCNFVYDISVLSNIPLHVLDLLDPSAQAQRLRPLFTVGVHDLPSLLEYQAALKNARSSEDDDATAVEDAGTGWIACTTDSILAMKEDLWDMLIVMPPEYALNAQEKVWPTVECPKGVPLKATQRDLRRFRTLQAGLARLSSTSAGAAPSSPNLSRHPSSPDIRRSTSSTSVGLNSGLRLGESQASVVDDETDDIVEPPTWAALAYSGFMWWASAGEQLRSEEAEELAQDSSLLADLGPSRPAMQDTPTFSSHGTASGMLDSVSSLTAQRATSSGGEGREGELGDQGAHGDGNDEQPSTELAIIAYFHRLTTQMFSVLADVVETSDDDDMLDVDVGGGGAGSSADEEDDTGEEMGLLGRRGDGGDGSSSGCVRVDSSVLANMGLDVWSGSEAGFVRELTARYFARRAHVEGKGVEVCGMRVC